LLVSNAVMQASDDALRAITLYQYMEAQGQYEPVITLGSL